MRLAPLGRLVAFVACSIAIGGCALGNDTTDAPAVIAEPTNASRAELASAVNAALGMDVALAADALTQRSILTIERKPIRDDSGRRIEVAERAPPETFRLVRRGEQCVLIHERTQRETLLKATKCSPR